MKIYGNDAILSLIRTMAAQDRIPHAALIFGEKGMGRRTIARYFAMAALCKSGNAPCGTCKSCRKVMQDIHPDVIWAEHSGKKNGFSVETVRTICKDAIVAPNDGERKVYLFADCDGMDSRAQNTLLKLTEEPPPHVLLLFTAEHRNALLPTMLSRVVPLAVRPCSPEECRMALTEAHECSPADAERAVQACGGNIGNAVEWLEDTDKQELTRQVAALTEAVAKRSSYEVLRILAGFEKDRQTAAVLLRLLDRQLRDALVMQYRPDPPRMGCDQRSAQLLSGQLSLSRFRKLHTAVQEAADALQASVSVKLTLAALGGALSV